MWSERLENLIGNLEYCGHDMYYDDLWKETIQGLRVLFNEINKRTKENIGV